MDHKVAQRAARRVWLNEWPSGWSKVWTLEPEVARNAAISGLLGPSERSKGRLFIKDGANNNLKWDHGLDLADSAIKVAEGDEDEAENDEQAHHDCVILYK